MSQQKRNCTSCKILIETGEREPLDAEVEEEEAEEEEMEDREEYEEGTTDEDTYSTDSEPDWDAENVTMRHMSWWQDRFRADREERSGHPLAPDLCTLLTEDPTKVVQEEDNADPDLNLAMNLND